MILHSHFCIPVFPPYASAQLHLSVVSFRLLAPYSFSHASTHSRIPQELRHIENLGMTTFLGRLWKRYQPMRRAKGIARAAIAYTMGAIRPARVETGETAWKEGR
jgi:hypothetical protein